MNIITDIRRRPVPRAAVWTAGIALAGTLAGCGAVAGAASAIRVSDGYVPQPTTPGAAVGYLTIRNNGSTTDSLVGAQIATGGTAWLRGPTGSGAAMRNLSAIDIPAGTTVRLRPGSLHLLITNPGSLRSGHNISLTLTFHRAGKITVLASVTDPQTGGGSYFTN
jgi:copper(I)-binding protein